jgi:phage protein D
MEYLLVTEYNWNSEGDYDELDCGAFEVDTVDFSGPPDRVSIKAVSTPISSSMRREEKTNAWDNTTLQKIAQDIAGDAELELMYEVESEIQLDRVDQLQQSSMSFLQELCSRYGVSLKVTDEKIVLFEESVYEAKDVVDTFDKSEVGGRLINYSFKQNTSDTVCKVISSYKDPKSGKLVQAEFTPPEPPATGQVALVNLRPGDLRGDNYRNAVDTSSEDAGGTFDTGFNSFNDTADDFEDVRADVTDNAMRQAKAVARKHNKFEWTCTLNMVGNPKMVSGANIMITGWGVYSGKYSIDEAEHKTAGGYKTTVKAHRCLVGY